MTTEQIQNLPLERISAERQIRTHFDEEAIQGLAASLKLVGQLQPIRVRGDSGGFVIVDGERRYRAAQLLGWTTLAVIIEDKQLDEAEVVQRQYISNCQREDLGPLEKARAMATLVERTGWKVGELASRLGISPGMVTRQLALLKLPVDIQNKVAVGKIPASAAYELSRVADDAERQRLAEELESGRLTRDALSGRMKAIVGAKSSAAVPAKQAGRVTAHLGAGRSVTVAGSVSGLEGLIEILEDLLAKCRRHRTTGVELGTFLRLLKDQTKSGQPA